ncbi:wax ester synthase/diacylglycerol acyltransferase 4-like isoform X1 [Rosa rugosa]|uniref:wax ester synthase/diacylglycerol acyltransferase 4-like isoform X1 n=1 Tax=Rosa rugosa TaxID=74645 RepID=UPI002B40307C|nr:wax ester synthase/diacylglycerol acyltransferase 4-like isoform X1 [Rosa rugosa]
MEFGEEGLLEPVSPGGQFFNSTVLSLAIIAVLEAQVPINDAQTFSLLKNVFLPINPRFSSIMVKDVDEKNKQWKRVQVKLEDHVHVPIFPSGMSLESYDTYFDEYITKIASETFPQSRPLWEIHLFKYPTSHAAGQLIFKIHHALGDGYSLMGALLSCLQNTHNPSLPLTFPPLMGAKNETSSRSRVFEFVPKILSAVINGAWDFSWSILKGTWVEDDRTPIRSGVDGVEFRPVSISTLMLSIEEIKLIKNKLGVTINDVIAGTIFLGTRMYMQRMNSEKSSSQNCTALVLLNTRLAAGYKSVQEMLMEPSKSSWGNRFVFLHVPVPKSSEVSKPLDFVWEAQKIVKRHRSSSAWYLTIRLWDILKKFRGAEVAAEYIHRTLMNSSIAVTNMIGPLEQMSLADQPIKGVYFMVVGSPQSLTITAMSYMGKLRIAMGTEKGFIDSNKLQACMKDAFQLISEAAN